MCLIRNGYHPLRFYIFYMNCKNQYDIQNGPRISSPPSVLHVSLLLYYLLTPRSRVLLEKLTGSAASQEIPRIFGTRRFITVLTNARHLSLS